MKKKFSWFLVLVLIFSLFSTSTVVAEEKPVLHIIANTDTRQMPWAEMGMFKDAIEAAGVTVEWEEISTGWSEKKPE